MQRHGLRHRGPERALTQPRDKGHREVRVQVLSWCLRITRVIYVKSGAGAACKDLEVRENMASSETLVWLSPVGGSSGREEWARQG